MHQLFPRALISCVREGRLPKADEVAELSATWKKSASFAMFQPHDVNAMAQLALGGQSAFAVPTV